MLPFDPSLIATLYAQTAAAVVMAILLFGFHRQYQKSYLLHWTYSWAALAIYYGSTAVADRFAAAATRWTEIAIASFGGAAGYLHIVWLLFGVYELLRRRPVRLAFNRRMLASAAVFGVLTALPFSGHPSAQYMARIGLRCLIAAIAFLLASIAFWRSRRRRAGVGSTMMAASFLAYSLEQFRGLAGSVLWQFFDKALISLFNGPFDFLLQGVIGMSMIASLLEDEREASELASAEISHLAYTDPLTGLPNRPLFMDHLILALAQAARSNQKVAVFFLDLDRFKDINDSLGHSTGDALLRSVADRIRRCVREGDTIARFGGDEFTLLIPRIDNVEDAAKIAQKIHETLKIPFMIADRELFVTTSIGITVYPVDGVDPETLVRNADSAMYRAKDSGRDNYQLYAPAMNARALERLALENTLRRALENDELVLHYQPLVSALTRQVVGFESLVRWQHPEQGLLSPAHFISTAEMSGLIVPIGLWILRTACMQAKLWQKRSDRDLYVAVNLSARQFQQPNLVDEVAAVLEETKLRPDLLELEITESNAMQNAEKTIYTLRELKALGVRIAMDDFGTGYSSLSYLKRFPIDTLKLDRSFVLDVTTDPSDAAIVSAVIAMAHSLKLHVVAEGVETEQQLDFLCSQNCDRIQGYFFSRPLPSEDLAPYIMERKALIV